MENIVNGSSDFLLKFISDCYQENSISHVMETAYKYLGNPCTLSDNNYRTISCLGQAKESDRLFYELANNETLSKDVMDYFKESGVMSADFKPLYPIYNPTIHPEDEFTSKRIGIAVPSVDNGVCGWFAVFETYHSFSETDVYIVSWLAKILTPLLDRKTDSNLQFKAEDVLTDLLNGVIEPDNFIQRLDLFNIDLPSDLRLLTISRKNGIIHEPLQVIIRSVFGKEDIVAGYQNNIVALIDSDKANNIVKKLEDNITKLNLAVSISQKFNDVKKITHCYMQNLECIKTGNKTGSEKEIYWFEDYTSELLLSFSAKHMDLSEYENPVLKKIRTYDKENKTEYYESLRVFTLYGNNMKRAAAELGIHRNTLNYRINMISRLFDIDLYNQETVLRLHLAYAINECQKI